VDANRIREERIHRIDETLDLPPGRRFERDLLGRGMHAGVRTASRDDPRRTVEQPRQDRLDLPLNRRPVGLQLGAGEASAVVLHGAAGEAGNPGCLVHEPEAKEGTREVNAEAVPTVAYADASRLQWGRKEETSRRRRVSSRYLSERDFAPGSPPLIVEFSTFE
jgi:hypothetical protein